MEMKRPENRKKSGIFFGQVTGGEGREKGDQHFQSLPNRMQFFPELPALAREDWKCCKSSIAGEL
jgi:hypothetical protein